VGQVSCTSNTLFFSFQWTNSFWSQSQKLLGVGAGSGATAKKLRCLELEPEPEILVPAPQTCSSFVLFATAVKCEFFRSLHIKNKAELGLILKKACKEHSTLQITNRKQQQNATELATPT